MTRTSAHRLGQDLLVKIVSGEFPPGLKLPTETELASMYNCGRSTVREALRYLDSVGVTKSRQGSGAIVLDYRTEGKTFDLLVPWLLSGQANVSVDSLVPLLLRTRTYLACEGARLAANLSEASRLQEPTRLLELSRTLENDPLAHAKNDFDFHRSLCVASQVWPAVWLCNILSSSLEQLMVQFPVAVVPDAYFQKMSQVLDCIAAGDDKNAVACMTAHLETVDRDLLKRVAVNQNSSSLATGTVQ
ncbi:MAG: GntR family transcriptional regulator [Myxococcota bacterium]|nr:GntR family transcriptional regulator [Myxococcota bacterium]